MRLLFSGVPAPGHLIPMLPLAAAARRSGHATALVTHPSMAGVVGRLDVLPVGPSVLELLAENARRHPQGIGSPQMDASPGPQDTADFFAGTRVDLTADDAVAAAADFVPDVVVAESMDVVGPLVAASLGVPWAVHAFGPQWPEAFLEVMAATAASRAAERGLSLSPRVAYLDPWPDVLHFDGWTPPSDRIPVRPSPYHHDGDVDGPGQLPPRGLAPRALVTFGTTVDDPQLLAGLLSAVTAAGVDVLVTVASLHGLALAPAAAARVEPVGFVPLARLLADVDVVVCLGGAGTVAGALSAGRPLVVLPLIADQPWNAERAASTGAGIVVERPQDAGQAVRTVLDEPSYAAAAADVAAQISRIPSPEDALATLAERVHRGP